MIRRKISGFVMDYKGSRAENVTVRFTSDRYGETLSLQAGLCQITVPYETVESLIKQERKKAGKK